MAATRRSECPPSRAWTPDRARDYSSPYAGFSAPGLLAFDRRRHRRRSSRDPGVTPCSSPRSANNCMPTQMPRKGAPRFSTASVMASTMPSMARRPRRQSAKAPTPGRTICSACRTTSGSLVTTIGRVSPAFMRGALESLGGRMQIAGSVIDDGDAHLRISRGNSPRRSFSAAMFDRSPPDLDGWRHLWRQRRQMAIKIKAFGFAQRVAKRQAMKNQAISALRRLHENGPLRDRRPGRRTGKERPPWRQIEIGA